MRLISADRGGDFFERIETLGSLTHERLDFLHPFGFEPRRDVDQHQRGGIDAIFADRDETRTAAHRSANEDGSPFTKCAQQAHQVLDHQILAVLAVRRPV